MSASLCTSSIAKAESFGVALAIREQEHREEEQSIIISDSQEACRLYMNGRLPAKIIKLIGPNLTKRHRLIWCPAHAGLEGNERADALARDLTNRAERQLPAIEPHLMAPKDILAYQRSTRQKYSAPHKSLEGEDATDLRKVQTGVFSNLSRLSKIYPTLYRDACPWCGGLPTLYHISWECDRKPANLKSFLGNNIVGSLEQWEAQLASSDPEVQLALLSHVRRAAQASGALDLGPQPTCS